MDAFQLERVRSDLSDCKGMLIGLARRRGEKAGPGPQTTLTRACVVSLVAQIRKGGIEDIAPRLYRDPGDIVEAALAPGAWLSRAVTSPAMTTVSGWAAELVDGSAIYSGLLASLAPRSAYARLSARGIRASLGSAAALRLPFRADTGDPPSPFVGEGQPSAVRQLDFAAGPQLVPKKASVISHFTAEIARYSTPSIEAVVGAALREDIGAYMDGLLLSDTAASDIEPAGLLAGVTALTPSTATAKGEACAADLSALAAAFDPGAADLAFIMPSAQAVSAGLLCPGASALSIIESDSLAAGTIIAIDASDFASSTGDTPILDTLDDATLVSRSDPAPVVDEAGAVAAPTTSLWQQDLVAIRVIEFVGWTMRRPGRVAFMEGVSW
ncbi:phage major capsid protein [Rhizobiaceae bacterium n13]|uniref:Phage major capsid protein n=1 Tax=Ferirhizobium litorale TaxID=2927786 RepID=A0AAE3U581_9HYPH|nr:phage major capsid protein [Fererhizobium litorale]MDI7863959.1 phage major capsid protein [Fererhizobium litorale]MDI7924208.1 phage major capsid protein [Fererhizobium litorale]